MVIFNTLGLPFCDCRNMVEFREDLSQCHRDHWLWLHHASNKLRNLARFLKDPLNSCAIMVSVRPEDTASLSTLLSENSEHYIHYTSAPILSGVACKSITCHPQSSICFNFHFCLYRAFCLQKGGHRDDLRHMTMKPGLESQPIASSADWPRRELNPDLPHQRHVVHQCATLARTSF